MLEVEVSKEYTPPVLKQSPKSDLLDRPRFPSTSISIINANPVWCYPLPTTSGFIPKTCGFPQTPTCLQDQMQSLAWIIKGPSPLLRFLFHHFTLYIHQPHAAGFETVPLHVLSYMPLSSCFSKCHLSRRKVFPASPDTVTLFLFQSILQLISLGLCHLSLLHPP